mmetsp:Transcript_23275/g.73218  ORF Transcript_23275/g.73218 Transcript_23275/m.73218 type:complete len:244 (-) Transcript_23275:131-862(-)
MNDYHWCFTKPPLPVPSTLYPSIRTPARDRCRALAAVPLCQQPSSGSRHRQRVARGASAGQSISAMPQFGKGCLRQAVASSPRAVQSSAWPSEPWQTTSVAPSSPSAAAVSATRSVGQAADRALSHSSTIGLRPSTTIASGSRCHAAYTSGCSARSSALARPSHEPRSISRRPSSVVGVGRSGRSRRRISCVCCARASGERKVRATRTSPSRASAAPTSRACVRPLSLSRDTSDEPWMMPSRL